MDTRKSGIAATKHIYGLVLEIDGQDMEGIGFQHFLSKKCNVP